MHANLARLDNDAQVGPHREERLDWVIHLDDRKGVIECRPLEMRTDNCRGRGRSA